MRFFSLFLLYSAADERRLTPIKTAKIRGSLAGEALFTGLFRRFSPAIHHRESVKSSESEIEKTAKSRDRGCARSKVMWGFPYNFPSSRLTISRPLGYAIRISRFKRPSPAFTLLRPHAGCSATCCLTAGQVRWKLLPDYSDPIYSGKE